MGNVHFTNQQIKQLTNEKKILAENVFDNISWDESHGSRRFSVTIKGQRGNEFKIKLRQSLHDKNDFSVILGVNKAGSNLFFILRRYNGNTHRHNNFIEEDKFELVFHVHESTERYQKTGADSEHFAKVDDRFSNLREAINCLMKDCNVEIQGEYQADLF